MRNILLLIGMISVLGAGLAAPSSAVYFPQEPKRFDLTLDDADLTAATQMLASQSGLDLQFVFKPTSEPYGRITLKLRAVTVDEAIKYICEAAGATYKKDSSGIYIIGRKGDFPAEPSNAATIATPTVKAPSVVAKIVLKHSNAREMLQLLFNNEVDRNGEWKAMKRFQQMNSPVATTSTGGPTVVNTPVGTSLNLKNNETPAIGGDNGIDVPGGANQGRLGGAGAGGGGGGQIGGGGQFGGGFGQGGQGQGQGNVNLQGGQGFVPEGIDEITYDPTDNSIIVRGTDTAIQELERIISRFDVVPKQVTVKVEFITTSNSAEKNFGIDWLFQRGQVFIGNTPGTQARAGDPFFLNLATGGLTARLRTLLLEGYGTVVNAPYVRTLNNQPAAIIQNIQTSIILSQIVSTGTQVITVPQIVTFNVASGLTVTPRINADGYITMSIAPQISELGQIRRAPDGTEVPDILSQAIAVTARVKNGETIVLGGLTRKQQSNTYQRFPVLSDLPIIGNLFKSTHKLVANQELLIFITPTIVEDEGSGNP